MGSRITKWFKPKAKRDKKLYYLVSPYSSKKKTIIKQRYERVLYIATKLIAQGYHLIEPIAMCHEKSKRFELPTGYEFWKERDRLLISRCDGLIVCKMDGLEKSVGCTDEIAYARELGMEIKYCDEEGRILRRRECLV